MFKKMPIKLHERNELCSHLTPFTNNQTTPTNTRKHAHTTNTHPNTRAHTHHKNTHTHAHTHTHTHTTNTHTHKTTNTRTHTPQTHTHKTTNTRTHTHTHHKHTHAQAHARKHNKHTPTNTPTHTHQLQTTCCTLTPPNILQTVPHAANKLRHRLIIDGVTAIELKCAEIATTITLFIANVRVMADSYSVAILQGSHQQHSVTQLWRHTVSDGILRKNLKFRQFTYTAVLFSVTASNGNDRIQNKMYSAAAFQFTDRQCTVKSTVATVWCWCCWLNGCYS
jgi:hypothetical protein